MVVSLLCVVALIAVAAGGVYGYARYRYDQIPKVHILDEVAAASGQPFTILVIGSDSRVGDTGEAEQHFGSSSVVTGQRSDVVQLWRVTPDNKTIQVLSIPRDTVVTMLPPDNSQFGTYNRINSSYNSGANQLVKTITANFGIVINHVVQVDFSGFQDAVNALGGIYLDFPYPAKDSYSGLNITTPGCQLLSGFQALAMARARHYEYYANGYWQYDPTSDFGRIQRQDVFLRALIAAAKSKVNPLTVNAFIGSIHEGITIDDGFGFNQLIGLALDYRSFDPANLQAQTLPTVDANDFGDLGDVLAIDQPAAQQMLVNIFGSSLVAPPTRRRTPTGARGPADRDTDHHHDDDGEPRQHHRPPAATTRRPPRPSSTRPPARRAERPVASSPLPEAKRAGAAELLAQSGIGGQLVVERRAPVPRRRARRVLARSRQPVRCRNRWAATRRRGCRPRRPGHVRPAWPGTAPRRPGPGWCGKSSLLSASTTPKLTVNFGRPATVVAASRRPRTPSRISRAFSTWQPGRASENSSPPWRQTRSSVRIDSRRTWENRRSARSPVSWP